MKIYDKGVELGFEKGCLTNNSPTKFEEFNITDMVK